MAVSYKDLTHTGDEVDAGITLIDSHAANSSIHVSLLDRQAWDDKQAALVIGTNLDAAPTEDSTNPVSSGGVFSALSGKQDTLTAGTNMDSAPTSGSLKPVASGGVYTALQDRLVMTDVWGLAATTIAPASGQTADLNSEEYYEPGIYRVPSSTEAGRVSNAPFTNAGFLLVVRRLQNWRTTATVDNRYIRQEVYSSGMPEKFYVRHFRGGNGWTNWFMFSGTDTGA